MSKADIYRSYAADCNRLALLASLADVKAMLLEMGANWQRRAERVEKDAQSRASAGSGPWRVVLSQDRKGARPYPAREEPPISQKVARQTGLGGKPTAPGWVEGVRDRKTRQRSP
jgi:hypothetical protein